MKNNVFKSKSLTSEMTDEQISNTCCFTRFISFEAAIRLFHDEYPIIKEKPIGYKVTEQGIEMLYK